MDTLRRCIRKWGTEITQHVLNKQLSSIYCELAYKEGPKINMPQRNYHAWLLAVYNLKIYNFIYVYLYII